MKREIKFRAWTGNRMIDFKEVKDMHATPWNSTSLTWMQSTGLLDKNGKEIYEGDVIKWGEELGLRVEIKWNENSQGWTPYINNESEIIGNIHENPELLK